MSNIKIKELHARLTLLEIDKQRAIDLIKLEILKQYCFIFDADKELQDTIRGLEGSTNYSLEEDGLYLWTRVDLTGYKACTEYLKAYLNDYCCYLDPINDCLKLYLGDDFISIQEDTCGDNGVWESHKLIIEEIEYLTEEGDVDIVLRNKLIELHMEKTGCFPNIGRVTRYGDFFPVNTTAP